MRRKSLLSELARALVRFSHLASVIVNANHSSMSYGRHAGVGRGRGVGVNLGVGVGVGVDVAIGVDVAVGVGVGVKVAIGVAVGVGVAVAVGAAVEVGVGVGPHGQPTICSLAGIGMPLCASPPGATMLVLPTADP